MAWTTPRTWTTGELVTAAIQNTHVRDNLLETAPAKVTTKGDLVVASASNTVGRLAVGADDTALVADSAAAEGVSYKSVLRTVRKNSTGSDFARKRLNFVEGANITINVTDDAASDEVDIELVVAGAGPSYAMKSADESVSSSTTLQNDDDLFYALAANEEIVFECWLAVDTNDGSGRLDGTFTVPTGATIIWAEVVAHTGSTSLDISSMDLKTTSGDREKLVGNTGTSDFAYVLRGRVLNGANAGNLQFQWCQDFSTSTATTVKAGSHLIVHTV